MGRASIRKTAFVSTFASMLLFASLAALVFVSNDALGSLLHKFRLTTSQTLAVQGELRRIQAAQTAAIRYWETAAAEDAAEAIENLDAVIACEASCAFFEVGSPERRELENIISDAEGYKEAFVALLGLEKDLRALALDLTLAGTRTRSILSDVMRSAERDAALETTARTGFALEAFLLGQTYAERFMLSRDALDLQSAEAEFTALKLRLSEILAKEVDANRTILIEAAARQVAGYEERLQEVRRLLGEVDRTRRDKLGVIGPMLIDRSKALHKHVFDFLSVAGPSGMRTIERVNTVTIALALAAVLVGSIASILFANRISSAVVGMARQMRRVADGDLSFEIQGTDRRDELGEMARALNVFQQNAKMAKDVDHLREQQRQLQSYAVALEEAKSVAESAALTDPLTGLANRRHLDMRLRSIVAAADPNDRLSALHVDLDRFKQINDTLGHKAGDHVLRHTAETLRAITRPDDFIARVGGDEFVILCRPGSPESVIQGVAARLVEELAEPIEFEGQVCRFGASVGAASALASEAEDLIEHADIALYQAKAGGRGAVAKFTPALRTKLVENKILADEILAALEREEFVPFFQPQFDAISHDLAGLEALARWRHPRRGLLTPDRFLGVAEEMRVVDRIDHQIMRASVGFCRAALAAGVEIPKMSVNVSLNRLMSSAIVDSVPDRSSMRTRFAFELLETIFFDNEEIAVLERIAELRRRGVEIEIDDFGSGHASVVGLMRVLPDRVKIDRALISPVTRSRKELQLVESIVDMVRGLAIGVVAEGVETEQHAMVLRDMGCEVLQGYHFARPMEGEALLAFLQEEGWRGGWAKTA